MNNTVLTKKSVRQRITTSFEDEMEEKRIYISGHYEVGERIPDGGKAKKKKDRKRQARGFFVAALFFFSLSLAALCAAFIYLDSHGIIPENLFSKILMAIGAFILLEVLVLLISSRSRVVSVLSILLCLAVLAASIYGIYVLYSIYQSMQAVEEPKVYYAHVGVYVKKDSSFAPYMVTPEEGGEPELHEGESLEGHTVGALLLNLDKGYSSQAMRILRKEENVTVNVYEDFGSMIDALRNGEVDAIVYNEAYMGIYLGEDNDFYEWAVEARSIGIETEHSVTVRRADVTTEPFVVYVSGLDTYDEDYFPDEARCDVNIIAAVDPVNKKVLLINSPRDYYVPLWGESYAMDKLTHAGVYGVECSMETLEALYDIEFNYYVRTNIYSLIKIVDALGGITVHSDFEFYAPNGIGGYHKFYVGENEVDGAGALCFIRERYTFDNGDRQRGIHQQECIRAIVEKACSPAIIAHFSDVLSVVESSIRTNIDQEDINALIKMQLSDMSSWSFETYSVDGYGSSSPSYAMGGELLYAMIPYYDTVYEARDLLDEFLAG